MNIEEIEPDLFRPEDARGVAELFREVYGDSYPAKIVYQPDRLVEAFESGDNIPVVVRTGDGRVIGYSSLFRAAPNKGVYEKGNGAVSRAYRNAGVMGLIFEYVGKMVSGIAGIKVFFGEPVCNHVYIQKAALAHLPFVETALEVDLMPAEAYEQEKSASGRVSTLLMFITVVRHPHTVYVPDAYSVQCGHIYSGLDDERVFSISKEEIPSSPGTRIETDVFDFARVARINVYESGADFEKVLFAREEEMLAQNVTVMQVFLDLSCPWIGKIADVLREKGYFFGGILPQWFGGDGLLMQKIYGTPNWEGIHVFSERAGRILESARSDWQRTLM